MASLFELTAEYQALLDLGDSIDPKDQQTFLDTLESMDYEVGLKADSYAAVRTMLKGRRDVVKGEIARLQAVLKTLDSNIGRMEDSLQTAMVQMGKKEIKTDLHRFRIVNNGGVLPIVIDGDVPDSYTKVILEPDMAKIRAALDAGEQLPFAHLGERGTHLRIS